MYKDVSLRLLSSRYFVTAGNAAEALFESGSTASMRPQHPYLWCDITPAIGMLDDKLILSSYLSVCRIG